MRAKRPIVVNMRDKVLSEDTRAATFMVAMEQVSPSIFETILDQAQWQVFVPERGELTLAANITSMDGRRTSIAECFIGENEFLLKTVRPEILKVSGKLHRKDSLVRLTQICESGVIFEFRAQAPFPETKGFTVQGHGFVQSYEHADGFVDLSIESFGSWYSYFA